MGERGYTTRCKPSLFFRVEVETNITWFRGGNIGPAPESPALGRRKRLRRAAESRGCASLDHGDPGEAPAGELWRQTQEHPSLPRLAASPSAAPSRTRLRGLPRVICRTPHPLPQPRPFLRARAAVFSAPSELFRAGQRHCACLSQVAGLAGSEDPAPVASFLSWCRRVGLELSPKVSGGRGGGGRGGEVGAV